MMPVDARTFPPGDAFVAWVDGAADLGHPQRDAVVLEEREREPVLVAVERPVRLANDHGVKLTARPKPPTGPRPPSCSATAWPSTPSFSTQMATTPRRRPSGRRRPSSATATDNFLTNGKVITCHFRQYPHDEVR